MTSYNPLPAGDTLYVLDSGEIDNGSRASMVAPLVDLFTDRYYHGPEEVYIVVQDLISDLMHYLDVVCPFDPYHDTPSPEQVVERAMSMYDEEAAMQNTGHYSND